MFKPAGQMNTSIKVVLYTSKKLSNNKFPVMLRIIKNRKVKYMSTGISCSEDLWDDELHIPKKKHPLYKEAKITIANKILEAEKLVLNLDNEDKNLSAYEIKGKLKKGKVSNALLFAYFDIVIARFRKSGQIKNSEIYKDTKRNLRPFVTSQDIPFSDVDIAFLNKFEEYLKAKGKGGNTIYLYLRTLRALFNKAVKEEVCGEQYYPFEKFSLSKYASIKTNKRAISKKNIGKIVDLKIKEDGLILARNLFLFSYYCRGMNFTDIAYLKWKDINNKRMTYTRQKTKELFNLELLDPALKILHYYKSVTYNNKESYVFPIFNENHKLPHTLYNRKVKMLRVVNANLKIIGENAKIGIPLTTYVARHTYATVLKNEGIPISIISQGLGHDCEKTTQIYLESFQNEILDKASRSIL